jgi:hypothetical protein
MTETTAEVDPFGRTPEEAAAARQRAREDRERIQARDWREVPKGRYAIPVPDFGSAEWEAADFEGEPPVIAYRLFERRVARNCKNGRVIGKDRFVTGAVMLAASDTDSDLVRHTVKSDRELDIETYGPGGDVKAIVDRIIADIADGDTFRAKFGQLTGRCGHCHRPLTEEFRIREFPPNRAEVLS